MATRLDALQRQHGLRGDFAATFTGLVSYLEDSQYLLIELMVNNGIWQGTPPPPPPDRPLRGSLEFGLFPYWIHHPPPFMQDYLAQHPMLRAVWTAFADIELPDLIDEANYQALMKRVESSEGVVDGDGTLYGNGTYEQLDENWLWVLPNYLLVRYLDERAIFPAREPQVVPLTSLTGRSYVRVAIVGDWGTGAWTDGKQPQCPSQVVMARILAMKPDYIVHLGDVYYAGTGGDFLPLGEEQRNLLDAWPTAAQFPAARSFTLNSNHEMYSGGKGLALALSDPRFQAQQGLTHFALGFGGWTLVGLDSAYNSLAPLFMEGSIGGARGDQGAWLRKLGLDPSRTLVLSHHNPLSVDGMQVVSTAGSPEGSLWNEVCGALGGTPAYWYWGHVHNGVVYGTPTVNGSATNCRCVGHGAIPFGKGWAVQSARVEWFAQDLNTSIGDGVRVNNGFALLDIPSQGGLHESIWSQGNPSTPVWANGNHDWQA